MTNELGLWGHESKLFFRDRRERFDKSNAIKLNNVGFAQATVNFLRL